MNNKKPPQFEQKAVAGDCVNVLAKRLAGSAHLVLCDSPYNIGKDYDSYHDKLDDAAFRIKLNAWIYALDRVLSPAGSLFVFAPDEWVGDLDVYCRWQLNLHRRSWIVWTYTFGVANQKNFSRSHTHILYFTKHKKNFTFNADEIRVPSARQLVYNDTRQNPKGKLPDNTWMLLKEQLEPYMGKDQDTWLESRICGTYKERQKHMSNQIPLPIWERIIKVASNPGDQVIDAFAGSGGSGVVCQQLNRNWLGIDISKPYVKKINERLAASKKRN